MKCKETMRGLNGGTTSIHLGIRTPPFLPSFFSHRLKGYSRILLFLFVVHHQYRAHTMIILKHNTLSANDLFSIERVSLSTTTTTPTLLSWLLIRMMHLAAYSMVGLQGTTDCGFRFQRA